MTSVTRAGAESRRDVALAGVLLGLCALAVFASDATGPVALLVGLPAIAATWLAACWVALTRRPVASLDRASRLAVGSLVALTAWVGFSTAWSIAGDASWTWLNRMAVLVCFLVLGLIVGAQPRGVRATLVALAVVVGAALSWALAGLVVPALAPDGDRIARLQEPIGSWNALALVADAGLAFATWLLTNRRPPLRLAGALLGFTAAIVVLTTQSRAGVLAGAAVVVLVLRAAPNRLETSLRLLLTVLPGLAVGAWILTRAALTEDGAGRAARVDEARWVALALALGVVAALLLGRVDVASLVRTRPRAVRRGLRIALAAVCLVALVGLVASVGNPAAWSRDQLAGECANNPDRFTRPCDNNRLAWWGDALQIARDHPIAGTGAGTYEIARLGVRNDGSPVTQPHSVPLQLVADLGIVGLALGLLAALGVFSGIRAALGRVGDEDRWRATVLTPLPLAWGLHALVDYDLDFVAVTGPVFLAIGVLLATGRPTTRRRRPGVSAAAVATGAALLAVGSLVLPALAVRAVDDVYGAATLEDAAAAARRARALNPLSLEAVLAQAYVAEQAGDTRRAIELYQHAIDMQPRNPRPHLGLAYLHYLADPPRYCEAYEAFNDAYTLDQKSTRWIPGGPLDVSRAKVNAGACEFS